MSIKSQHQIEAEKVNADVKAFLAQGGQIQQIPITQHKGMIYVTKKDWTSGVGVKR